MRDDNPKSHHGESVTEWPEQREDRIAVFNNLPPYRSEVNPDKSPSGDFKNRVRTGTLVFTEGDPKHKAQSFMRILAKRPNRVKSYFKHPALRYAG